MLLSLAYLTNLILNVLGVKALSFYYGLDSLFFSFIIYGHLYPVIFLYFLYERSIVEPINIVIGILDYFQMVFLYLGITGINIAQYLSYRNSSIVINFMLSYLFLEKTFCKYQKVGILVIFISCIAVIFKGELGNIVYSLMILSYSFIYSLIGFLMEYYKEKSNITQIKLVSSLIHMCSYFFYSLFYVSLIHNPSILLFLLIIFLGSSEYVYYFLKNRIIQTVENGSIYTNILDMIRRVATLLLGILIFNEKSPSYLYYFYGIMLFGCVLFYFNKEIKQRIEGIEQDRETRERELVTV